MIDIQPTFLCVDEWRKQFSPPPHPVTVLRWIKHGAIQPVPRKMGRNWYIATHAVYVGNLKTPNLDQNDEHADGI